jgi:hypothetical protein
VGECKEGRRARQGKTRSLRVRGLVWYNGGDVTSDAMCNKYGRDGGKNEGEGHVMPRWVRWNGGHVKGYYVKSCEWDEMRNE